MTSALTLALLDGYDPHGGRGGRYLCPLPACATHQDPRRHRSVHLDRTTGEWCCHRCKAGGIVPERCPHDKVRGSGECARCGTAVDRERGDRPPRRGAARAAQADRIRRFLGTVPHVAAPVEEPQLDRAELAKTVELAGTPGEAYLAGREIVLDDARGIVKYAPSWFGRGQAVVFPCRDPAGRLVAAEGKYLMPNGPMKSKHTGPMKRGAFFTSGAREAKTVAITESAINALNLAQLGLPAIALFGSSIGPERAALLRELLAWKTVVIATDADDAGNRAAEVLIGQLVYGPPPGGSTCLRART